MPIAVLFWLWAHWVLFKLWRQGAITRNADDKYTVSGRLEKVDDETIEITELPIRKWTIDYKAMLESWLIATEKVPASIKVCFQYKQVSKSIVISC